MTIHQSKGLEFDIVVLPQLDVRLSGQPPAVVVGRPQPTQPIDFVCRYANKELQALLPREVQTDLRTSGRAGHPRVALRALRGVEPRRTHFAHDHRPFVIQREEASRHIRRLAAIDAWRRTQSGTGRDALRARRKGLACTTLGQSSRSRRGRMANGQRRPPRTQQAAHNLRLHSKSPWRRRGNGGSAGSIARAHPGWKGAKRSIWPT